MIQFASAFWNAVDPVTMQNGIAAGAVFIALLALFIQSRATQRQLRLQNFAEYTKRYQEIILHFPESINEPTFSLEGLPSKEQRDTTLRYMRAYFDLCSEEFFLHQENYIDRKTWDSWKEGMIFAFAKPSFQQAWAIIRKDTRFGKQFQAFADSAMVMTEER